MTTSTIPKSKILNIYKALHRACQKTFKNDDYNLNIMRMAINENFQTSKKETDPESINKLYEDAIKIEKEIRTQIIQVEEIEPGHSRLNFNEDHCVDDPASLYKGQKFKNRQMRKDGSCK